jgi:hypothetical protein
MEAYILDTLYRRVTLVDTFDSFIWTERFSAAGDFQLVLPSTLENRNRFPVGTRLGMNKSKRVMTVTTVQDSVADDGTKNLTLTGKSLEAILDDRVAHGVLDDTTAVPKWTLTGLPAALARKIFHDICVTGVLSTADRIPGVTEASIYPADTIAEPSDTITIDIDLTTVYTAVKNVCDLYDMGFRLVRDGDTSHLYWDVYMGSDRTTEQTTLAAVVFSPDLENLQNTTELTTIESYKNCAYVFSPVGYQIVYALDIDPTITGFDRHVLLVNATDITDVDVPTANAKMIQRGKEELSKNRQFSGFDGEISQFSNYIYETHYYLGDLVELRNDDGVTNHMQVTEQIFVSDKEGERSYPTLSVNTFITPGSWAAWDFNQEWSEVADTEHWADQ